MIFGRDRIFRRDIRHCSSSEFSRQRAVQIKGSSGARLIRRECGSRMKNSPRPQVRFCCCALTTASNVFTREECVQMPASPKTAQPHRTAREPPQTLPPHRRALRENRQSFRLHAMHRSREALDQNCQHGLAPMDSNRSVANETQRNISRAMPETRSATISDSVARPRNQSRALARKLTAQLFRRGNGVFQRQAVHEIKPPT